MDNDPRYTEPNARTYPPVTRKAILPYYLRLVKRFGGTAHIPVGVLERRGMLHTRELFNRWERKAKRAETAMRKLRRRLRSLERAAKTVTADTLVNAA